MKALELGAFPDSTTLRLRAFKLEKEADESISRDGELLKLNAAATYRLVAELAETREMAKGALKELTGKSLFERLMG